MYYKIQYIMSMYIHVHIYTFGYMLICIVENLNKVFDNAWTM